MLHYYQIGIKTAFREQDWWQIYIPLLPWLPCMISWSKHITDYPVIIYKFLMPALWFPKGMSHFSWDIEAVWKNLIVSTRIQAIEDTINTDAQISGVKNYRLLDCTMFQHVVLDIILLYKTRGIYFSLIFICRLLVFKNTGKCRSLVWNYLESLNNVHIHHRANSNVYTCAFCKLLTRNLKMVHSVLFCLTTVLYLRW